MKQSAINTVLVTGAGGALGRVVVDLLRRTRAFGTYADNAAGSRWHVLASSRGPSGHCNTILDVGDRDQVLSLVGRTRPALILHLAATLSDDFDTAFAVNVQGARNLCDAMLASGQPSRLLLAGSAAEYGVVLPAANPIPVDHPLRPISLYGMTKAWQSMLGQYYASTGSDVVIARIFNLDGPGLSDKLFAGRIRSQIAALKAGRQQSLNVGSLSAVRDYLPIATAAEQILTIASHGARGAVYHVGSGKGIRMRELLQACLESEGLDLSVVDEDSGHSNRKGYDVPAIFADMSATLALPPGPALLPEGSAEGSSDAC